MVDTPLISDPAGQPMRLKMIACEVFTREICHCVARTPHIVDLDFTEKGAHDEPDNLRALLQSRIDAVEDGPRQYDAILLGFGLCGNSVVNLTARRIPLVLPRAHDCCTIFLGSRQKFVEHFGDNPSTPFSSAGYRERSDSLYHEATSNRLLGMDRTFDDLVEKYGEENARYIYETLNPPSPNPTVVYIEVPETAHLGYAERCRAEAEAEGKAFRRLTGSMRLIEKLIFGDWDETEFLIVRPGESVSALYDWNQVVRARPR